MKGKALSAEASFSGNFDCHAEKIRLYGLRTTANRKYASEVRASERPSGIKPVTSGATGMKSVVNNQIRIRLHAVSDAAQNL